MCNYIYDNTTTTCTCPKCGAYMHYNALDFMWQCDVCGHTENGPYTIWTNPDSTDNQWRDFTLPYPAPEKEKPLKIVERLAYILYYQDWIDDYDVDDIASMWREVEEKEKLHYIKNAMIIICEIEPDELDRARGVISRFEEIVYPDGD